MNVGKLDSRVQLMEPLYVTNDYGRVTPDGFIHHERWGEVIPQHSKYFSIRFAGWNEAAGILRVRKDDTVLKCEKVSIDNITYIIDSIIPFENLYYEVIYSEDVD